MFRNTAESHETVSLPVFWVQCNKKRQHIYRCLEYIKAISCADVMKAVAGITAVHISLEPIAKGIEPSFVRMAGNTFFIQAHEYSVMVFLGAVCRFLAAFVQAFALQSS